MIILLGAGVAEASLNVVLVTVSIPCIYHTLYENYAGNMGSLISDLLAA
jgi:hypothetical protein